MYNHDIIETTWTPQLLKWGLGQANTARGLPFPRFVTAHYYSSLMLINNLDWNLVATLLTVGFIGGTSGSYNSYSFLFF